MNVAYYSAHSLQTIMSRLKFRARVNALGVFRIDPPANRPPCDTATTDLEVMLHP